MKRSYLQIVGVLLCLNLCECWAQDPPPSKTAASPVQGAISDYGTAAQAPWRERLQKLNRGQWIKFRIVQIGDSHTAADFFTGQLRDRLQERFGNGGIGWVYPAGVRGQRMAKVDYKQSGWGTLTSRQDSADFPLGGVLAQNTGAGSVSIFPRNSDSNSYNITAWLRPVLASEPLRLSANGQAVALSLNMGSSQWQAVRFQGALPLEYQAAAGDSWQVGGFILENSKPGVTVSAMGINGAQLSQWSRWRSDWPQDLKSTQADLVILAYGTNEAFENKLDLQQTRQVWTTTVARIRQALPNAGILIIGAPESLKNGDGSCGTRPAMLDAVQSMQQDVAKTTRSLYWSWQNAMGGACSMKTWQAESLGRRDGVHFSADGYRKAADHLADALIQLAQ